MTSPFLCVEFIKLLAGEPRHDEEMCDQREDYSANAGPKNLLLQHWFFRSARFRAFNHVAIAFKLSLHPDREDAKEAEPPGDDEDNDKTDGVH